MYEYQPLRAFSPIYHVLQASSLRSPTPNNMKAKCPNPAEERIEDPPEDAKVWLLSTCIGSGVEYG
jgi:hypothetical protein